SGCSIRPITSSELDTPPHDSRDRPEPSTRPPNRQTSPFERERAGFASPVALRQGEPAAGPHLPSNPNARSPFPPPWSCPIDAWAISHDDRSQARNNARSLERY